MAGCARTCCENFYLPLTLEEIKESVRKGNVANGDKDEYSKLLDMLISTGRISKIFNCKYFNKETRLCVNYENRPVVCKQHPTSKPCSKEGCTEPMTERILK